MLYALGAGGRVVGVSGYTVTPAEARKKPKVGAYTTVNIERVMALKPDLVLAYSDLQAEITASLVRQGATVLHLNHRTFGGMCAAIELLGQVVGAQPAAAALVNRIRRECDAVVQTAGRLPRRPRVYFEEWDEPLIAGIGWVSEAVTLAGGEDVFADVSRSGSAKDRVVAPEEVRRRNPDIIFASWCGKKVRMDRITTRPGWSEVGAVRTGHVHEIKAAHILQPGPGVLKGMKQMADLIAAWSIERAAEVRPA